MLKLSPQLTLECLFLRCERVLIHDIKLTLYVPGRNQWFHHLIKSTARVLQVRARCQSDEWGAASFYLQCNLHEYGLVLQCSITNKGYTVCFNINIWGGLTNLEKQQSVISMAYCSYLQLQLVNCDCLHIFSIHSLQYFLGVAGVGALFVGCPEAAWLQQCVWPPVKHHGGGRRGNDSHCITHPGLDVVVPFVIRHGDKPWDREREMEWGERKGCVESVEGNMEKDEKEGEGGRKVWDRGRQRAM